MARRACCTLSEQKRRCRLHDGRTYCGDPLTVSRVKPARRHRVVSALSAAARIAGLVSAQPNATHANRVAPIVASDSDEIALGAALAAQFDSDRGVAPTAQSRRIEAYLQRVTDSLARFTRR